MTIRSLFDPSKDIYRTIEKVITYGASQEGRLKAEISEYVVTDMGVAVNPLPGGEIVPAPGWR